MNHGKTPLMYAVSHGQPEADPTSETSLTLTGLQPYKEYTISVKAQNRRGSGVPVTGTVRTYSDSELISSKSNDKYLHFHSIKLNSDIQGVFVH